MRWVELIVGILLIIGALWCSLNGYIETEILCAMSAILIDMNLIH